MKMKDKRYIQSFGKFNENLNISDVSDSIYTPTSDLLYCMETRRGKIYVTLYHKRYFDEENFDDHDVVYKIDNKFYKEFKKTPYIKGSYNNEYNPVNFKTEKECEVFLNSFGLISV